jgi:hypothetical protein
MSAHLSAEVRQLDQDGFSGMGRRLTIVCRGPG